MNYFVTGTDTGVGKTYVSCLILKALREAGRSVIAYKPACCGDRDDVLDLHEACDRDDLTIDEINPLWLQSPAAPLAAAMIENREVDFDALVERGRQLATRAERLIVEGAGGWEVPLTGKLTMADLAVALGFPVIVVIDNKLGALNHTILTVRQIEARGLKCAGLILNQVAEERDAASISNRIVLQQLLDVPILAELLHDADEIELPDDF
ncbi:MAG: dethiobiotin synthetase [Verrucomicrobiales bacterium]|jgi:dethiobiotin synthetase